MNKKEIPVGTFRSILKQMQIGLEEFEAISNNHILITNNTEHFERIEGLKIQNWVNM